MKSHAELAAKRGCYCGLWDKDPQSQRDQGLPEGFCGKCETCGAPGHTRHFPGPVPYTGSWCERHWRLMFFTDPRTRSGLLIWLSVIAVVVYLIKMR